MSIPAGSRPPVPTVGVRFVPRGAVRLLPGMIAVAVALVAASAIGAAP
jgi:hypothetical protein